VIIRVMKLRKMKRPGHVARIKASMYAYIMHDYTRTDSYSKLMSSVHLIANHSGRAV
jgi:hypothetical protein